MERVKEGGGGGEERKETRFLPSPPPPLYFIFGSHPIFREGKTPKIPFFAPKPHGNACYAAKW